LEAPVQETQALLDKDDAVAEQREAKNDEVIPATTAAEAEVDAA